MQRGVTTIEPKSVQIIQAIYRNCRSSSAYLEKLTDAANHQTAQVTSLELSKEEAEMILDLSSPAPTADDEWHQKRCITPMQPLQSLSLEIFCTASRPLMIIIHHKQA